jgi:hypothetical protein
MREKSRIAEDEKNAKAVGWQHPTAFLFMRQ